jgi:electron transport complex protein RnfE
LGAGTLLAGADRLFGPIAENWTITLFNTENPFLLAILPPGAFLGMGLLIAIKNSIDAKLAAKQTSPAVKAERVRVTAES